MSCKITELAIDCADPAALAQFWCTALGYEVQELGDGLVSIGAPTGNDREGPGPVTPALTFARVPEGKVVKNRLHFDVNPTDRDQEAEIDRLLLLGASYSDVDQDEHPWAVLEDPEGNEFCVLATRLS